VHLNYDAGLDSDRVNTQAAAFNEGRTAHPFRRYASVWLKCDDDKSMLKSANSKNIEGESLADEIEFSDTKALLRDDIEDFEHPVKTSKLPSKGMQIHAQYTLYAPFFLLKK